DQTYVEHKEINNKELFNLIDSGASYSTSQPSPDVFVQIYEQIKDEYDYILSLHCTPKVSGTVNAARIASTMVDGLEGRISVIDLNTASIGEENIIIKVCQLIDEGKSLDELLKVIEFYRNHTTLCLVIDDLNTLVKTGRLSKTAASIGNLLNIKPIIGLVDAQLDVLDKVRTKKRVLKWMVEHLKEEIEKSGKQIVRLTYSNDLELAQELKKLMEEACGDQAEVHVGNEIGPVMAIHFGRGGVGACWMPDQYKI
ncbi:DegV family EDD domain-containing protein, partial [Turicibacter sanguinis]|nr:DegV family EDD domain-containing protein [Turicibacter sanguinis]